jgi:protein transport protein SEC24
LNEAVDKAAEVSGAKDVLSSANVGGQTASPAGKGTMGRSSGRKPTKPTLDENSRRPVPISRVFVIDVSWSAVKGGIVREVCEGIKRALYGDSSDGNLEQINSEEGEQGEEEWRTPEGRVGIITFDRAVHYYNLSVSSTGFARSLARRVTIYRPGGDGQLFLFFSTSPN